MTSLSDLEVAIGPLIERAWTLYKVGNFVAALDLASEAVRRSPEALDAHYVRTLALASCGSTPAALEMYRGSPLAESGAEDHQALEARLLKDLAWAAPPGEQPSYLIAAAARYEEIHRRTSGVFSGINAATLSALAGEEASARAIAQEVDAALSRGPPAESSGLAAYFHWVARVESAAVLEDYATVALAMQEADRLERRNLWARARTGRQLSHLARVRPRLGTLLEAWHVPAVGVLLDPDSLVRAETQSDAAGSRAEPVLVFYAAPGGGPDRRIAALRAAGMSVHVVAAHAERANPAVWRQTEGEPHDSPLDSLVDVSGLHLDLSQGTEEERRALCADVALGASISRALQLRVPWCTLALEDGHVRVGSALNSAALRAALQDRTLSVHGRPARFAHPAGAGDGTPRTVPGASASPVGSRPTAILFADLVGYSRLGAGQVHYYWSELMPRMAAALVPFASDILLKKTWGDAVHAIAGRAGAAARIANAIRAVAAEATAPLSGAAPAAYRISLHWGLVEEGFDPIDGGPSFFGPQLSLCARAEPVTPPGGVYVTEPFAARLALEGDADFECAYVGKLALPKQYGELRLLSLQRSGASLG